MKEIPGPGHSIIMRLEFSDIPGFLGRIATCIGRAGGSIGAVDIVHVGGGRRIRDITVNSASTEHASKIVQAVSAIPAVRVINVSDRTFLLHLGGKITIQNKTPLRDRDTLSMAYTPGVARVCMAIHEAPEKAYSLTIKGQCVAIVSDGTAVLGLGDIGPEAAMPVMEGKAMLFKAFGAVDAFPLCLATTDTEEIIAVVKALAPTFGGINLEDISAPRCFEIERRLTEELDIPVFHDDQHGTAVVVYAALINALKVVGKPMNAIRVVISGAGAAGLATARMLRRAGCKTIIACDRNGAICKGRVEGMNPAKAWFAQKTNPDGFRGSLKQALAGADVFIGVSAPDLLNRRDIQKMAPDAIVFALANPIPEIMPEEAALHARIVATGRSDYANQINNVLCFPGLFRGALDCRARLINEPMKMAAARAIASIVKSTELNEDYIIPSVFNRSVAPAVAKAVARAAHASGVARRGVGVEGDGSLR